MTSIPKVQTLSQHSYKYTYLVIIHKYWYIMLHCNCPRNKIEEIFLRETQMFQIIRNKFRRKHSN
jgi:hypothetical protein